MSYSSPQIVTIAFQALKPARPVETKSFIIKTKSYSPLKQRFITLKNGHLLIHQDEDKFTIVYLESNINLAGMTIELLENLNIYLKNVNYDTELTLIPETEVEVKIIYLFVIILTLHF